MLVDHCFNPRARDGRDRLSTSRFIWLSSFNPRARDGRDGRYHHQGRVRHVSTHAPVMGATSRRTRVTKPTDVSTHAPVMGATGQVHHMHCVAQVSTHAPVMGATRQPPSGSSSTNCCFNPRARDGRDCDGIIKHYVYIVSTHAPVMGATHSGL